MFGNRDKKKRSDDVGSFIGSMLTAQMMQVSTFCEIDWKDSQTTEASVLRNWVVGLLEGYFAAHQLSLDDVDLKRIARSISSAIPGNDQIGVSSAITTCIRNEPGQHSLSSARSGGRKVTSSLNQSLFGGREAFVDSVSSSVADLTMLVVGSDQHSDIEATLTLAKSGDPEAQTTVSMAYMHGIDVEKDIEESIRWMLMAANGGNAEAQFEASRLYERGVHVEEDLKKSFEWCEKAANQGNGRALRLLAIKYANGRGVEKDPAKFNSLALAAAEHGDLKSMELVGCRYCSGSEQHEQNEELAIQWLTKPAEKGFPRAQFNLGKILLAAENKEDRLEGIELLREAAKKGNEKACYPLDRDA